MVLDLIFYAGLLTVTSILIIFLTTRVMIKKKNIWSFLPLFILGLSGIIKADFAFNQVYLDILWISVEILILFGFFLILINLRRGKW